MYSHHGNRELQQTIDAYAEAWNYFVALCRRYYAIYSKYPGKKALMRHLTKLKQFPRFARWNLLPSQSKQDAIQRIDNGYQKMFADRRQGKKCGRPRFKAPKRYKSFPTAKNPHPPQAGTPQVGYPSIPGSLSLERSDTVWLFGVRGQAGWKLLQSNSIRIGQ